MAEHQENYSLISDIGGTNIRLQLIKFKKNDVTPTEIKSENYKTKDFATLLDCIQSFLKEFEGTEKYPQNATLAIAGAPMNNKVKLANALHWPEVNGNAMGEELKISPFILINDFEGVGYAILKVPQKNLIQINKAEPVSGRAKVAIGSGTGLGECVLTPRKDAHGKVEYLVCPTEGGHKDFAPTDEIDWEYLRYIRNTMPEYTEQGIVCTEKAFCGQAIPIMYKFFAERMKEQVKEFTSKEILQLGLKGEDKICVQVLDFYAKLYGKEVANFACDSLPYAGIYLVGGMINSVSEYFLRPDNVFLKAYGEKDRVTKETLAKFPIYIVTQDDLGLFGAFVKAQIDAFPDV